MKALPIILLLLISVVAVAARPSVTPYDPGKLCQYHRDGHCIGKPQPPQIYQPNTPVDTTPEPQTSTPTGGDSSCNGYELKDEWKEFQLIFNQGLSIPYRAGLFKWACFKDSF